MRVVNNYGSMALLAWILGPFESGLLYMALGVFGGASVVGVRVVGGHRDGRALGPMLGVGIVLLTALLAAIAIREGHLPVLRRYEILLVAAWGLGVGAWLVSRRADLPVLMATSAPTLALLVFFGVLLVPAQEGEAVRSGVGTVAHIVLALGGFAGFSVSAGVGALYLVQIRRMKNDPGAALSTRMPSLERLDRINLLAAAFGFPCLALSVVAGQLFLGSLGEPGARWWLDPTVLATGGGLVIYLLLFVARSALGWYGRRIAWMSVIGFVVAVGGFVVAAYCTSESALHP